MTPEQIAQLLELIAATRLDAARAMQERCARVAETMTPMGIHGVVLPANVAVAIRALKPEADDHGGNY